MAQTTDVSAAFIQSTTITGSAVTVAVGSGTQTPGLLYGVRVDVTVGTGVRSLFLTLPCQP